MKNDKPDQNNVSRPKKVMLHLAKVNSDWAGLATDFKSEESYKFKNLKELIDWINSR